MPAAKPKMTSQTEPQAETQRITRTVATAGSAVAMAASAVSILTAFGYILSYRYLRAFYRTLGAEWAIDLYPPTQIMQISAPLAIGIIGLCFTVWTVYPQVKDTKVSFFEICVASSIAAVAFCTHLAVNRYLSGYTSHIWIVAAIALGVAVLMLTTKVLRHVFESDNRVTTAMYLLLLAAYGIFSSADFLGTRNAQRAGNENSSSQREVRLASDSSGASYRLVAIVPYERALLRSERNQHIEYRVLPLNELIIKGSQRN